MTTELNAGFEMEATTLTQPVDVDQLIDGLTDSQLDRLTIRLRRRANQKLRETATLAALKAERERVPTPVENVRNFIARHQGIDFAYDEKYQTTFYENGSLLVPVDRAVAMAGAVEHVQQGGAKGPLDQVQVIWHFFHAKQGEALRRKQEVLTDNAQCATSHGFCQSGQANATELARVDGIIKSSEETKGRLLHLIDLVRQIEQQHTGEERDRLIAEAIATEPETATWMSKKED